ncbi:T9SS type A sorting domain-containing protein [candidate division KSB1 bacterium]|nr:T9SS type A sorting domain-containing protein [candidate division KSB1 bacterium]
MSIVLKKAGFVAVLFSLFVMLSTTSSRALDNTLQWTANWIWQAADGPENTWMCFRKNFNLESIPTNAIATIAVDSKYWMTINNELVVFEGGLNRGPTPTTGYFDRVDIQPYLVDGENTIAILLWYWGNEGRNNVDSGQGGLLFQAELGSSMLISDSSWKIKVHPAYGFVPFQLNDGNRYYLYGGWNIGFDARNDMPGWNLNDYNDSLWFNAVEKGVPPCAPWNELWERPIPQWKNSGLQDYVNAAALPDFSDGRRIYAKLPYNAQVTPYFKIDAPAGLLIKIETDHYDTGGYYGQRTEYITREGVQEYESLAWQNGEKVLYDIPAGVRILELKYRETGYDTEFAGSFACDDDFYNTLAQKAVRTLTVCMRDNYMDCPDRERGQWIGDVATQIPQTFYALDRKTDKLTLKAVSEFINWRDGHLLKGLAPGADLTEFASQSLNAISDIGIMMTYYMHTGDLTPIVQSYNAIKDYLYVWSINEDGLITPRATWNGQGVNVDHILIENTWYYMALKSAKRMAELTGNPGDIAGFQTRLDTIANNFDQNFWRGDAYRSSYFIDDRANGLVVLSGLAGTDKYPALISVLKRIKNARPYMEGYVLEALFQMGKTYEALARMREKYAMMVNDTTCTTLWEAFWPHGTTNHAWSGAPLASLCRYVAGVYPVIPGYSVYQVLPQLGPLTQVKVVVPSIKGEIHVSIDRDDSHFNIHLTSPHATTAIVGIPKNAFADDGVNAIEANNTIIWRRGFYIGGEASTDWFGEDDRYYKFKVSPGRHRMTALRAPLVVDSDVNPAGFIFAENYPNPFNSQTSIKIRIPAAQHMSVKVYDTFGNHVCTLFDGQTDKTEYQLNWNGTNERGVPVASGLYYCEVICGQHKISKKMLMIR